MRQTVTARMARLHQVFFQGPRPAMAKVDPARLNLFQIGEEERHNRRIWGEILHRVPRLLNLSDGEFADRIGVKQNQLGAWFTGAENAALWRFWRDADVRLALERAMVERDARITATTSFTFPDVKVG